MNYQVEQIERPKTHTLSIRTRAAVQDLPKVLGESFGAIGRHLGALGEPPAGPPFAAYYNEDMQDLDLEIGFPVGKTLEGEGSIQAGEIPEGTFASYLHIGPYKEVEPAYKAVMDWIEAEGAEATGVCYELYLNDPGEVSEAELQTQVLFPLA
jgi:effector-binding domain-containing protein